MRSSMMTLHTCSTLTATAPRNFEAVRTVRVVVAVGGAVDASTVADQAVTLVAHAARHAVAQARECQGRPMRHRGLGTPLKEGEGNGGGGSSGRWVSVMHKKAKAGYAASSTACTLRAWQGSAIVSHDREVKRECIRGAVCVK